MNKWMYVYGQTLPNQLANSGAVLSLCEGLLNADVQIEVVIPSDSNTDAEIRCQYDLPDTLHFRPLLFPQRKLSAIRMAFKCAANKETDVFITRMPVLAVILATLRRKTILELHHKIDNARHWKFWRHLLHLVPPQKLLVASLTQEIQSSLDTLVLKKSSKVQVIPSAARSFPITSMRDRSYDCGYVGSFLPGKGIEMVYEIAISMTDTTFVVYGDHTKNPDISKKFRNLPNVKLGGFVDQAHIGVALNSFKIGLAPYSEEGFGGKDTPFYSIKWLSSLKVIEYMSAGCAVISSSIQPIRHVITHDENGLLCDPNSLSDWIEKIHTLKENPDKLEMIASTAKVTFQNKYTFEARAGAFKRLANV
ncbi:glycosyltransferase family 4 protein [Ponticaulis sp.]|uniref:glycosyltransferase family 4 protein n=1 Tax=Ponticaulis sp. TaxID=2020902 RepID=UPI000B625827|nr:glycosyltransferase family 4 protein [Ponticaulis sp.]MAI89871.1 hypothetical protein [Ponticaulis sp.]OUX99544.1 MAG: hypothetical protein CBB65_05470 [Hyphomonadaceae bacterium TMED5]